MAQYCVYTSASDAGNLNPKIAIGDTVCVECPSDNTCKPDGRIKLKDEAGKTAIVQLQQQGSTCADCPAGGTTGYTYAGGGGGW
jgi:hypothetical protein